MSMTFEIIVGCTVAIIIEQAESRVRIAGDEWRPVAHEVFVVHEKHPGVVEERSSACREFERATNAKFHLFANGELYLVESHSAIKKIGEAFSVLERKYRCAVVHALPVAIADPVLLPRSRVEGNTADECIVGLK